MEQTVEEVEEKVAMIVSGIALCYSSHNGEGV